MWGRNRGAPAPGSLRKVPRAVGPLPRLLLSRMSRLGPALPFPGAHPTAGGHGERAEAPAQGGSTYAWREEGFLKQQGRDSFGRVRAEMAHRSFKRGEEAPPNFAGLWQKRRGEAGRGAQPPAPGPPSALPSPPPAAPSPRMGPTALLLTREARWILKCLSVCRPIPPPRHFLGNKSFFPADNRSVSNPSRPGGLRRRQRRGTCPCARHRAQRAPCPGRRTHGPPSGVRYLSKRGEKTTTSSPKPQLLHLSERVSSLRADELCR